MSSYLCKVLNPPDIYQASSSTVYEIELRTLEKKINSDFDFDYFDALPLQNLFFSFFPTILDTFGAYWKYEWSTRAAYVRKHYVSNKLRN